MKDPSPEERWTIHMVQARRLAERDQHADAVARAAQVKEDIARAVDNEPNEQRRARLRRMLERVEREHDRLRAEFEAWRGAIGAKRQERIAHEADVMARPLPVPAPPHR